MDQMLKKNLVVTASCGVLCIVLSLLMIVFHPSYALVNGTDSFDSISKIYALTSNNSMEENGTLFLEIDQIASLLPLNVTYRETDQITLTGNSYFYDSETGLLTAQVKVNLSLGSDIATVTKLFYWQDASVYPITKEYTLQQNIKKVAGKYYISSSDLASLFSFETSRSNNDLTLSSLELTDQKTENTVYEVIQPTFSAGGFYKTDGSFMSSASFIYTKLENALPVRGGDTFRMSYKTTNPGEANVLFLDSNDQVLSYVTNTQVHWESIVDAIIQAPENATKMLFSEFNNQTFSVERVYTIENKDLSKITKSDYDKKYLSILAENQKKSRNQNYYFKPYDKGYITFVNDDSRPVMGEVVTLFENKNIPLSMAGVNGMMTYPTSDGTETRIETAHRAIRNGGELLAHEANVVTDSVQYDTNKMFRHFFRQKYLYQISGFDPKGVILAGGTGQVVGTDMTDMYARNYYQYSDLYGKESLGLPYYKRRAALSNYKDSSAVIAEIDKAIQDKQWTVMYFHDYNDISQADLEAVLDYVNTLSPSSLEIANYSDMYTNFIASNPVVSMQLTQGPTTTDYIVGDTFDGAGMILSATLQDGTGRDQFTDYSVRYQNGESFTKDDTEVTIYAPGTDASLTIPVTVTESSEQPGGDDFVPVDTPNLYPSYNGHLKVKDGKLVNRLDEEFRLIGMSGGDTFFNFDSVWSEESLGTIKQWGANVVRVFVMPYENYRGLPHYVGNETEYYDNLKIVIDRIIAQDMYVNIVWAGNDLNSLISTEFFEKLSSDYRKSPYILYELDNEPYAYKMNEINDYAKNLISVIRKNNPNALIVVPTEGNSPAVLLDGQQLTEPNVMYSYHQYMNSQSLIHFQENLLPALEANKPVLITEWSSTDAGMPTQERPTFDEVLANVFVKLLNKYNVSWMYFCYSMTPWEYGITGQVWDNALPDQILTNSGHYIKNLLQNQSNVTSKKAILGLIGDGSKQGSLTVHGIDKNSIQAIIFETRDSAPTTSETINGIRILDVSYMQDQGVQAYFTRNNEKLEMHIFSSDTIVFPFYSSEYFMNMKGLEKIDFAGIDTSRVNTISRMFNGCTKLDRLDLSQFNFSNIEYMRYTFTNAESLREIVFSDQINTSKLKALNNTFENTKSLITLDLSHWDLGNVTEVYNTFQNAVSLETLRLPSNLNLSKVTSGFQYVFHNCKSLKNLDLTSLVLNSERIFSLENTFYSCTSLQTLQLPKNRIKVNNLANTFAHCTELSDLDLSAFDTENVTSLTNTFYGLTNLKSLNLNKWNLEHVTSVTKFINLVPQLSNLYLHEVSVDKVDQGVLRNLLSEYDSSVLSIYVDDVLAKKAVRDNIPSKAVFSNKNAVVFDGNGKYSLVGADTAYLNQSYEFRIQPLTGASSNVEVTLNGRVLTPSLGRYLVSGVTDDLLITAREIKTPDPVDPEPSPSPKPSEQPVRPSPSPSVRPSPSPSVSPSPSSSPSPSLTPKPSASPEISPSSSPSPSKKDAQSFSPIVYGIGLLVIAVLSWLGYVFYKRKQKNNSDIIR